MYNLTSDIRIGVDLGTTSQISLSNVKEFNATDGEIRVSSGETTFKQELSVLEGVSTFELGFDIV